MGAEGQAMEPSGNKDLITVSLDFPIGKRGTAYLPHRVIIRFK